MIDFPYSWTGWLTAGANDSNPCSVILLLYDLGFLCRLKLLLVLLKRLRQVASLRSKLSLHEVLLKLAVHLLFLINHLLPIGLHFVDMPFFAHHFIHQILLVGLTFSDHALHVLALDPLTPLIHLDLS